MNRANNEEIDIGISGIRKITDIVKQRYDFDLNIYAGTSLKRRIARIIHLNEFKTIDGLTDKLEKDPSFFTNFQTQLSVPGTEFFRDPAFWRLFRDDICKSLKNNHSRIRIWLPGCSSGEEVLTTAITLKEAGLLESSSILATDLNKDIIDQSRQKIYSKSILEISENNYKRFKEDESASFSVYYKMNQSGFTFPEEFYKNIEYDVFNDSDTKNIKTANVVICRNYFIYLNASYQDKLLEIYTDKLILNGYLAIGNKETISFCKDFRKFSIVNESEKTYKKIMA